MPGSLTIIGSRDGTGKSFFAMELLHVMAEGGQKVHFISLEDTISEMGRRLSLGLAHPNLSVSFPASGGVVECASIMERLMCVVAIDYLQICVLDTNETTFSREGQVAGIPRHLKNTARRLGLPVILTSQVGRPKMGYTEFDMPSKYELAESSRIEKPSEYIIMMCPEADREHVVLELAKAKDAPIGFRTRLRRGPGGRLVAPSREEVSLDDGE